MSEPSKRLKEVMKSSLADYIDSLEAELIHEALSMTDYNCSHAAQILRITRTCLVEKRRKYGFPLQTPYNTRNRPDDQTCGAV